MAAGLTYEPIATTTLSSATTSITFNSISGSYTDLVLVANLMDSNGYCFMRFNNDSNTNYSRTLLVGNGSTAASYRSTNQTRLDINATTSGSTYWANRVHIMNYSNTAINKSALMRADVATNEAAAFVFLYRSTSAITRVDIISPSGTATIAAGSTATLYGIAAA
jgi:hypothetical protein